MKVDFDDELCSGVHVIIFFQQVSQVLMLNKYYVKFHIVDKFKRILLRNSLILFLLWQKELPGYLRNEINSNTSSVNILYNLINHIGNHIKLKELPLKTI